MPTRKPFVGGNWKCNGTQDSISKLIAQFNTAKISPPNSVDVVIAPSFLHINLVKSTLRPDFKIAAQNCYTDNGAFTGEVSPELLKDFGVEWVIIGHSERRHVFGEGDKLIGTKTQKARNAGLGVILCLGETLQERDAGKTLAVIIRQLQAFAQSINDWTDRVVIAYEPVWAIGTGKTATAQQAQQVHKEIRKWLSVNISTKVADRTRIIYGGSVKPENCQELFDQEDVDGFLVGGASLQPNFVNIINACTKSNKLFH
jgi:triosephosphate isomerase